MKRQCYQKLLEWKRQKSRNPLILNGVRQCGKTFLLTTFGTNEFSKHHYFNFERQPQLKAAFEKSLKPHDILNALSFELGTSIDTQNDLVIFDEIQAIPNALTSLKYFQEDLPELALCSAGSLLGIHLNNASYPVGKVSLLHLTPMNFTEFLMAIDDEPALKLINRANTDTVINDVAHQHLWERLKWYFITGGLPKAVDTFRTEYSDIARALQHVRALQLELINNYYGDMAKHAGKANAMHLDRIWRAIPAQLARTQDGSAKRFQFKGVVPGIDRYSRLSSAFDWLENTGLILRVPIINSGEQPLSAYIKEESFFKAYLFDVGILGALSGLAPKTILDYDYGTYKGYFAENFVAQEFTSTLQLPLYCWESQRNEVEFVMDIEGDVLPIEVKSGNVTRSQSLSKFVQRYKTPYRTVMSARNLLIDKTNHLHQHPLYLAGRFPLT